MSKLESSIKMIPYSQEQVYNKLSDLNNLESIKDKIPEDKIKDFSFDAESITFNIPPAGNITLQIVEKEPHKCIKFATTVSPVPFALWIQLVPVTESECKTRLTLDVEINPMMKMMIEKPIKEGLEKMAEMIAVINYEL